MKVNVPVAVGLPEITPPPDSVSPGGSVPEITDQVYDAWPPIAASVAEYAALVDPPGSCVVVIPRMLMVKDFVAVAGGLLESLT
jgi:hypothetical protein